MTLTEFLLARIAEDEAAATAVGPLHNTYDFAGNPMRGTQTATDLRRVRDCEAKRRIVERSAPYPEGPGTGAEHAIEQVGDDNLRDLAAIYADHPDYREEWKP